MSEKWTYKMSAMGIPKPPVFIGDAPIIMKFEMDRPRESAKFFEVKVEECCDIITYSVETTLHPNEVWATRLGWLVGGAFIEMVGS
jgi:hypothetical protein